MKKILLIIPFLVGGISFAQAQQNNCLGQSRTCRRGQPTCTTMQAMPGGPISGYGLLCFEDGEAPPPQAMGGNGGNGPIPIDEDEACEGKPKPTGCKEGVACRDIKGGPISAGEIRPHEWRCKEEPLALGGGSQEVPKKCPAGKKPSDDGKKCVSDCMETLAPNKPELRTVDGIKNWWEASKNQIAKKPIVQPLPAGPTTNGFSAGAGIVAGEPTCTYIESPEEVIVNTCARNEDGRHPPIDRLSEGYWDKIYKKCGRIVIGGVVTYPKAGKMSCTKASVFDALWGFLTHRKPY